MSQAFLFCTLTQVDGDGDTVTVLEWNFEVVGSEPFATAAGKRGRVDGRRGPTEAFPRLLTSPVRNFLLRTLRVGLTLSLSHTLIAGRINLTGH